MATVTGLTAARMLEIEGESIIDGEVIAGHLILTKHDGTTVDVGSVIGPAGATGPAGPAGGLIPGEIRMWPGNTLPELANYGKWDWCDGGVLVVATYPIAAGHIDSHWRTFGGASDPGVLNFRKPDMRGVVPAGLDAMPGGARANRMTRAVAITIAAKTGEETHVISVPEMAQHAHPVNDPGHGHYTQQLRAVYTANGGGMPGWDAGIGDLSQWAGPGGDVSNVGYVWRQIYVNQYPANVSVLNTGGNNGHETVQPTVFVPYIVKLDD